MCQLVIFNYDGIDYVAQNDPKERKKRNTVLLPDGTLLRINEWLPNGSPVHFTVVNDCPVNKIFMAVPYVTSVCTIKQRVFGDDILRATNDLAKITNSIRATKVYHNVRQGLLGLTSTHFLDNFRISPVNGRDPIRESCEYEYALVVSSITWPPLDGKENHRGGRRANIATYCQDYCGQLAYNLENLINN